MTKYTSFHKLASTYINDIVSSIDFDKDEEDRCRAVHWNQYDPKIIASVSDDGTVKSNMENSAGSINTDGNVFSIHFHPTTHNFVAHGCADGNMYYHSFCNIHTRLYVLTGHKKL